MNAFEVVQDKAILFESTYNDVLDTISDLQVIKCANASAYLKKIEDIKEKCMQEAEGHNSKSYDKDYERMFLEQIYSGWISKLEDVKQEIENNYGIYIRSYYNGESMRLALESTDSYSEKQIKTFATMIIRTLKEINSSNTLLYDAEKHVVETLYALAYQIIKEELNLFQKSTVLDWARNNNIATSYLNSEIRKDIDKLKDKRKIMAIVARLKQSSNSLLDEELLSILAICDNKCLKAVSDNLTQLYQDIKAGVEAINKNEEDIRIRRESIERLKLKLKNTYFYQSLAVIGCSAAALVAVFTGIKFIVDFFDGNVYNTETSISYVGDEEPQEISYDYQKEIVGFKKADVKVYQPWELKTFLGLINYYERETASFTITAEDYDLLEEIKTFVGEFEYKGDFKTQTEIKFGIDEVYENSIIKITEIIQDENDYHLYTQDNQVMYWVAIILITLLINAFAHMMLDEHTVYSLKDAIFDDLPDVFKSYRENKKLSKKALCEIKDKLLEQQKILQENEPLKARFMEIFERYGAGLESEELKEYYKELVREKKGN